MLMRNKQIALKLNQFRNPYLMQFIIEKYLLFYLLNLPLLMGQRNSKNTAESTVKINPYQQEGVQQIRNCCGFSFLSTDNMKKQNFNWKSYALQFCSHNSSSIFWASDIAHRLRINTSEIMKSKYLKQFNDVQKERRNQLRSSIGTELPPIGNSNYKQNLQNSILLHQNQVNKTNNVNRNTIQSIMEVNLANQRRSIFNSQMFNKISINRVEQHPFPRMSYARNSINLPNERISFLFKQKDEQISNQKCLSLNQFIQYSTLLQKHLTDPEHELFEIIQQFKKTLYQKQKENTKLTEQQMQQLIRNIKMFIYFLVQLVRGYYSLDDLQKNNEQGVCLISIQDNLVTLITTILFKNDTFYNFVFQIIKTFNKENDQNYSKYLKLQKQYQAINKQNQIQNINIQIKVPYQKCSQILVKINKSKTPISKMKLILQCAQKISQCIAEFYKIKSIRLENKLLDADQILSIFCQILAIKQIEYISSHLFFIDSFATQNHKISITGYYFSVLTCAVSNLSNYQQQIQQNGRKSEQKIQEGIQLRSRQKGSLILSIPSQKTTGC